MPVLAPTWRCLADYAARFLPQDPPVTEAIGIDEVRRGKPNWQHNPDTGKWELVADCFHLVQLTQRRLADLRRRLTHKQYGRRARKGDAVYAVRRLLGRNAEVLDSDQRAFVQVTYMGTYGRQVYSAWQAKELLRDLLGLAVSRTHLTPDRSAIGAARYRFLAHVADHSHLPELRVLAQTLEQWWDPIEAYLATRITNAASEGNNRLIKLEARNAFGHAVQLPAGADERPTPINFEDPE